MNRKCYKCHTFGHVMKDCHQITSKYHQYEPAAAANEEITILEHNLSISISLVKIINLLGIQLTIKKNDKIINSRLFKESTSPINKFTKYIVIEGKYKIEVTFFLEPNDTTYVNIHVHRDNKILLMKTFDKEVL